MSSFDEEALSGTIQQHIAKTLSMIRQPKKRFCNVRFNIYLAHSISTTVKLSRFLHK